MGHAARARAVLLSQGMTDAPSSADWLSPLEAHHVDAAAVPEAPERVPPRPLDGEEGPRALPRAGRAASRPRRRRDRPRARRRPGGVRGRPPGRGVRDDDRPRRPGGLRRRAAGHAPRLRPRARRAALRRVRPRLPHARRAGAGARRRTDDAPRAAREPRLVRQGVVAEGAAHRPAPRHAQRRGGLPAGAPVYGWQPLAVRPPRAPCTTAGGSASARSCSRSRRPGRSRRRGRSSTRRGSRRRPRPRRGD